MLRIALRLVGTFLSVGLVLFGAVVAADLVPNEAIQPNVRDALAALPPRSTPAPLSGRAIDTVSECLGMSVGLPPRAATHLERAIMSPVYTCTELHRQLSGREGRSWNYFRYWHGYQVLTRPWLAMASYQSLRLVWTGALVLLLSVWVATTVHHMGPLFSAAFFLPFLGFPLDAAGLSVLQGGCWVVAAALSILVLTQCGRRYALELFLASGMATAYWDLLTNPLISFGLPAIVHLSRLARDSQIAGRTHLMASISCLTAWSAGYFGFWIVKFVLGISLLGDGAARRLIEVIFYRLRGGAEEGIEITLLSPLIANLRHVGWWGLIAPIPVLAWLARDRLRQPRRLPNLPGLYLLMPIPFIWLTVAANHSQLHAFFTYRIALIAAVTAYVLVFWAVPTGVGVAERR